MDATAANQTLGWYPKVSAGARPAVGYREGMRINAASPRHRVPGLSRGRDDRALPSPPDGGAAAGRSISVTGFCIIYVLDPSPDKTELLLRLLSADDPRVEVIVMSRRFGHQAALDRRHRLQAGATPSSCSTATCSTRPSFIAQMVERWENGADIVQMVRQDGSETALVKRLMSRWLGLLPAAARRRGGSRPPGASDYRLLSQRVAEVAASAQITERNPFLRGLVSWVGFDIVHVPFHFPAPARADVHTTRSSTLINFALNGICSFSKFPLRFCVALGMIIACLSWRLPRDRLLYVRDHRGAGWASLIAALCSQRSVRAVLSRRHRRIHRFDFRRGEGPAAIRSPTAVKIRAAGWRDAKARNGLLVAPIAQDDSGHGPKRGERTERLDETGPRRIRPRSWPEWKSG